MYWQLPAVSRQLSCLAKIAFDLAPKSLDQIAEAGLARRNAGELLGVIERRGARCAPGGGLPVCFRVLVLG